MPIALIAALSIPASLLIPYLVYKFSRYNTTPSTNITTDDAASTTSDCPPLLYDGNSSNYSTPTPAMSPADERDFIWQTTVRHRERAPLQDESDESEEYIRFGTRVKTGLREKLGLGFWN